MRRIVIPTLMLMLGCATGAVVREVVAPARAQGQRGPNYEFETVIVEENSREFADRKKVLAQFGNQGWHLAAATSSGPEFTFYFERQKAQ